MSKELLDYVDLLNGAKLYLLPVSQMDLQLKTVEATNEFSPKLEWPWYWSVEPDALGKGGEKTLWTKADVEKDGTDEEKAQWAAYEQNQAAQNNYVEDKVFRYILSEGTSRLVTRAGNELDLIIDPITGEWEAPKVWRDKLNGNAPSDPAELKTLFLLPMIKDVETKRAIVSRVTILGMKGIVTEEDFQKYDAIFRHQMAEVGKQFDTILKPLEAGNGGGEQATLDVQLSEAGTEDGENVAGNKQPKPVGRTKRK